MICSLTSHESRSTHLTPVAPAAPLSPFLEAPVMVYTDHPLIQNLIERVIYKIFSYLDWIGSTFTCSIAPNTVTLNCIWSSQSKPINHRWVNVLDTALCLLPSVVLDKTESTWSFFKLVWIHIDREILEFECNHFRCIKIKFSPSATSMASIDFLIPS